VKLNIIVPVPGQSEIRTGRINELFHLPWKFDLIIAFHDWELAIRKELDRS